MDRPARAAELIGQLGLKPHPEGGCYAEVHRSATLIDPRDGRTARPAMTSIYFLLEARGTSRWHQVASDEVWLHLEGAPVELHLLDWPARTTRRIRLAGLSGTAVPQCTAPAGTWQAAQVEGDGHALLACVVAPGFEFADFRMLDPQADIARWLRAERPALARLI